MEFIDPRTTPFARLHDRGELPHLYKPGGTYFVTFRLADAITPAQLRPKLVSKTTDALELAAAFDPPLTFGSCILKQPAVATIVQEGILSSREECELLAWCIMPNHVHIVFAPSIGFSPPRLLQSWKGRSSRLINQMLGRSGPLWERESFDHLIRNVESLERFIECVEQNPVKAGLCQRPDQWQFSSACGAGFSLPHSEQAKACTTNSPGIVER
jgi:putative transposase